MEREPAIAQGLVERAEPLEPSQVLGPGLVEHVFDEVEHSFDRAGGIREIRLHGDFHPGNALFLEKIYLRKAFTGLGLGSALMHQFCSWGRELGMKGLWLETMYRGPARSFYLKHGFRFLGTTEVPYPEVLKAEKAMWAVGIDLQP